MNADEKRKIIIEELKKRVRENGLEIRYSSPKITYFYMTKKRFPIMAPGGSGAASPAPIPQVPDDLSFQKESSIDDIVDDIISGIGEPVDTNDVSGEDYGLEEFAEIQNDDEEIDYEKLTPKEFKRLKKEKEKEEKRFLQIRKDAHKRGYDTSVLRQFEDPEELYSMTDQEIEQITAVGLINEDGFYDFVFPADADSVRKEGISKKKVLLVILLALIGGGVLFWLFINVTHMF